MRSRVKDFIARILKLKTDLNSDAQFKSYDFLKKCVAQLIPNTWETNSSRKKQAFHPSIWRAGAP